MLELLLSLCPEELISKKVTQISFISVYEYIKASLVAQR